MAKRVGVDKWLFFTILILTAVGLAMVFSASAVMAREWHGSPYFFVSKQAIWAVAGVIAMAVLMRVDYRRYNSPKFIFPMIGITTVMLAAVFAFRSTNYAHRWIHLGALTLQPSELAKPVLCLYLAWFLHNRLDSIKDWRKTLLPALVPAMLFVLLIIKEPDLGTALVLLGMTAMMMLLAGLEWKYIGYAAVAAIPALYFLLFRVKFRADRIKVFLHPESDLQGIGFNINQSLIAVSTGGWFGHGYMEGVQKLFYLPEPHTDFIFANIAEELGLIGALVILALFVVLGFRGLRAALLARDPFARFIAFGITTSILTQAFFNISSVIALVPTKGIALPFISSGGTSLCITLASMGILLNVTREID